MKSSAAAVHGAQLASWFATRSRARPTASSTGRCCARSWPREPATRDRGVRQRSTASSPSAGCRWTASPHGSGSTPYLRLRSPTADRAHRSAARDTAADVHLSYAVKANPMPAVVQHLAGLVDCARRRVRRSRCRPHSTPRCRADRISFAGPGKTAAEIAQAVAAGVTIEMESATEAERVIEAGEMLGVRPRVAVRVNPDFQVKGSGMRMGGGPQQFGVDAEQVPELLADLAAADLEFVGFHVFAGSQNLNAEILVRGAAQDGRADPRAGREGARAGAVRQPRRRLRHPLLRQGRAARSRRDRGEPRRAGRQHDRAEPAGGARS